MKIKILLGSVVFCLALLNLACDFAYSVTASKIKDILDHPRDYAQKEILSMERLPMRCRFWC